MHAAIAVENTSMLPTAAARWAWTNRMVISINASSVRMTSHWIGGHRGLAQKHAVPSRVQRLGDGDDDALLRRQLTGVNQLCRKDLL